MTNPIPPTNVRIQFEDGRDVPLDTVYAGLHEGVHVWRGTLDTYGVPVSMTIEELPPHTRIETQHLWD